MLRYILLILLSVASQTYAFAERKPYEIASVPTWVRDIKLDATTATPIEQVAKGAYYLLSDNQVRVDATERVSYKHFATKALNGQGVESVANIEIEFDPSFQKLTLHTINVYRGDLIIPKLSTSNIRVLQREKDLEALILDGSKTASILGARQGDGAMPL